MKKKILSLLLFTIFFLPQLTFGQTGTEFWFAPPEVTSGHGGPNGDQPINLRLATGNTASTVTIDQPALGGAAFAGAGTLVFVIPANSQVTVDLTPYITDLETSPQDQVLNTGLHILGTASFTAYYELNTTFNPEIFALKGANGLGKEFYTPFNTRWRNGNYTPTPYTSFDIVASEDNTTVLIYPLKPLDGGHPALTPFSVTLNRGQTYSGSVTSTSGADNPAGTTIVSDKPIAVSVKDDSVWPEPWGGCKDLMGDQIVPVNIIGQEYIAKKGLLNANIERVFITAVKNNTQLFIDGVFITNLFAGQTYDHQLDNPFAYITSTEPVYAMHISGFGCEMGAAILPPLNCAGSEQVSFVRSQADPRVFGLSVIVRAGSEGNFQIDGNPLLLQSTDFTVVPGTGGLWMGALVTYSDGQISSGVAHQITNSSDVFSLGLINGGGSSGCRFGYFSEFAAKVVTEAGPNQTVCANDSAQLSGDVSGGTTTGIWTSSGSGTYIPSDTDLNAIYAPSPADISAGTITLTLTSTGQCTPIADNMVINFSPAPIIDAGVDASVCTNNASVSLNATVTVASGGIWSGGGGVYSPNNTSLITAYTPSAAEIAVGTVTLTVTSAGNGTCNPVSDDITITITPSPAVSAGSDLSVCSNNPDATLSGSVTFAGGGIWSGGAGTFNPSTNSLNATYTPSAGEITAGNVTLTLTSTSNGNCNSESDNVTITYTDSPTANAGIDQTLCANNATATLNGSVTIATGGQWTGGLGVFSPSNSNLNASYTPTAAEIASGVINLTLTSTGNGNCNAELDVMTINFTASPTVNAGIDQTVCANNPDVNLVGVVTIATGGQWIGGTGVFSPNNNSLSTTYTPSSAEIIAGTVTLTLQTTGNGTCTPETDDITITITPSPIVDAGSNTTACKNNPDVTLGGSVSFAGGGFWSGGAGSYSASNTDLNAIYTPSSAELTAGTVTLTLTSSGNGLCNSEADNVTITYTNSPVVNAGIDQTLCANNATASLIGSVSGSTGGIWSGGLGLFSPSNTSLNPTYTPTAVEISSGIITLTLTSTGNGTCNSETDDIIVNFTASPTADAGLDAIVCANAPDVNLAGVVTVATGGQWTGGGGIYSLNSTDLNATYTPSSAEITAGAVTLTLQTIGNGNCNSETDDMVITIQPTPIVNAGPNLTSCANNVNVNLAGVIQNATGGIWSGGTGSYNASNTDLNAVYTPSITEIAAGSVTLTLTSTGNGLCNAIADDVLITIINAPTANAGIDQSVCGNNSDISLNGSVTGASGGQWTGGLGLFTPSNNALNVVYTPTLGEITSGSLTLTLTTTGVGLCNQESDDMIVTFTTPPTTDAGPDLNSCANNPNVNLAGVITIATGGIWSGGTGSFSTSNADLNATYTPSSTEITAGTVTLYLTSTGNGNCNPELDSLIITIDPVPTVNAGADQSICVSNLNVSLSGTVSGITNTGQWSTSGSGFFIPNNTTLNATYAASSADSISGVVTLTLTSTNNGNCLPITDVMVINILPAGIADAGTDATVCGNNSNVLLSGVLSGAATSGIWTTSGTGTFIPNNTDLSATYSTSAGDIASGTVTLTLTANSCNAANDDMIITITPEPIVTAGPDQTVCVTNLNISLTGSVSGASTTGLWTTLGTGTFTPNANDPNATYNASPADSIAQTVTIIFSATNIGTCLADADTMIINMYDLGTAGAGADQILCENNGDALLFGIIGGGATQGLWTTSGTGSFSPNNTTANATYIPSPGDLIVGTVSLLLTATNSCNLASDNLTITYTPAPVVDAGLDQTICGTNPVILLAGSISGATAGIWSTSGSGTFSPNTSNLNTSYTASLSDVAVGSITIYLTSVGNGNCNAEVDSMTLDISTGVVVDAGADQTVCSTAPFTVLQGSVTNGSTTGKWATLGTGTFSPSDTVLITEYYFSSADSLAGTVTLFLTSTYNGSCLSNADTMTITLGNSAYAFAGADQIVCANNMNIVLSGIVSGGASLGQWTTTGSGGFSPNDTALNAIYIPSSADSLNGSVNIILSTTDHGSCLIGTDTLTLLIDYVPVAIAGNDIVACENQDSIQLSGAINFASGGNWTTSGSGTFSPNDTTLQAVYLPSSSDMSVGVITLTLTSQSNGLCPANQDDLTLSFINPLNINFDYIEACVGNPMQFYDSTTVLSGSISNWHWNFGDGDTSIAQHPTHIYTTSGSKDVTLTVTSSLGCDYSLVLSVILNDSPVAGFTFSSSDHSINEAVNFIDQSTGATSWLWVFGDTDSSVASNPQHTYLAEGIYLVTQTVFDNLGCSDQTSLEIIIQDLKVFPPVLPTGFSPNGDGENDVLLVRGGPFKSVHLVVYNNWGNLIFESEDAEVGWDGTWKGTNQFAGDYVFTVKAITIDDKEYVKHGSVSIIR